MGAISYFYATPTCALSTNAPNLVDRIVLQARAAGTCVVKANIPQFDVQRSSGKASTNAPNLVDVPILRASAACRCWTPLSRLYGRLPESSAPAQLSNQFTGNHHRIITPLTMPMTLFDTYIESFSWSGVLGAGHLMEILDSRGAILAREVSGQASDSAFFRVKVGRTAKGGYSVPSLDSGVLVITTGKIPRNELGGSGQ